MAEDSTAFPHDLCSPGPGLAAFVDLLRTRGYDSDFIARTLGQEGIAAAQDGSPAAALWHLDQNNASNPVEETARDIVAGVYLRQPLTRASWEAIATPELIEALITERALLQTTSSYLKINVDIRPVQAHGHGPAVALVASDPDATLDIRVPGPQHVPGVGHAPLSLLNVIPPLTNAHRALDLGAGSGVLSLLLRELYPHVHFTATDIHARALDFGKAAERQPEPTPVGERPLRIDWRQGSWFAPVSDELFDVIISNPPFVIGPQLQDVATEGHIYRDSGLALDGASELVVRHSAEHLAEGGRAHLLAGWALQAGETVGSRVLGWLPESGIRAWVVQRDEVDVTTYVSTWLRDESIDPRSDAGRKRTRSWLQFFADRGVHTIALGYVHVERLAGTDGEPPATEVHAEKIDWPLPPGTYLGHEVAEWFDRLEWISSRSQDEVVESQYAVRPGVAIDDVSVADEEAGQGFSRHARRISRTEGPCYSHDLDEHVLAVVSGLHPDGLRLRDVIELYCAVHNLDDAAFTRAFVPVAVDLIRHGIIIPTDLLSDAPTDEHA